MFENVLYVQKHSVGKVIIIFENVLYVRKHLVRKVIIMFKNVLYARKLLVTLMSNLKPADNLCKFFTWKVPKINPVWPGIFIRKIPKVNPVCTFRQQSNFWKFSVFFVCQTNPVDLNMSVEISTSKYPKTKYPKRLINLLPKKLL